MTWSTGKYRLDEIEQKFRIPCVIRVNEGFYAGTDAEGFSAGDILSIDRKLELHKVVANFAYERTCPGTRKNELVAQEDREILVPLNYKGKLNVLRYTKYYGNVGDLAHDFPKYAKILEDFTFKTTQSQRIIKAGTVFELDKIKPGSSEVMREQDLLVIKFNQLGRFVVLEIPFTENFKAHSEPDHKTYTIKEAIETYGIPQFVMFLDEKIKKVYTQDLMEGIANMKTITDTLQLNRIIKQKVLVGHYKPIEEASSNTETVRQRTLIVIPLDNKEVCEIEVNVLEGGKEEDYQDIFMVRNISKAEELIDGTLFVDYASSNPGIRRICNQDGNASSATCEQLEELEELEDEFENASECIDERCKGPFDIKQSSLAGFSIGDFPQKLPINIDLEGKDSNNSHDDYEIPTVKPQKVEKLEDDDILPPLPPKHAVARRDTSKSKQSVTKESTKKEVKTSKNRAPAPPEKESPIQTEDVPKQKGRFTFFKKEKHFRKEPLPLPKQSNSDDDDVVISIDNDDDDNDVYAKLDETQMEITKIRFDSETYGYKTLPPSRQDIPLPPLRQDIPLTTQEFVPLPQRGSKHKHSAQKLFRDLTCKELVERLKLNGLGRCAKICKSKHLNGAFFQHMSPDTIEHTMHLDKIDLEKFIKMRDENWMTT